MPGVSSSSIPLSTLIHCFPRVTPGLSPAMAAFRPARLLMKVDLPTFGMPTAIKRIFRPLCPFRFHSLIFSSSSFLTIGEKPAIPRRLRESQARTA